MMRRSQDKYVTPVLFCSPFTDAIPTGPARKAVPPRASKERVYGRRDPGVAVLRAGDAGHGEGVGRADEGPEVSCRSLRLKTRSCVTFMIR
jgi:hypothetical protein